MQTRTLVLLSLIASFLVLTPLPAQAAQKGKKNAQEKKDDTRVQNARQDVNEAERRIQNAVKELKEADGLQRKASDAVNTAKKNLDDTRSRLENWISQNLRIPEAIESQRMLQQAYDEAAKPLVAAMRTNPKYATVVQRADAAEKLLKSLATNAEVDEAQRKQLQAQASKDLADWRYAVSTMLDSASELKGPREKLAAAQTKLTELRSQLKKQLELHPDLTAAQKKWEKTKTEREQAAVKFAALQRKIAADQGKLASEKAQLNKAVAQDKQNDNKNKNNNNKNKNRNKKG